MLHQWETFYVIVGSSAAALTGLQFVVIALSADARAFGQGEAVAVFATPTIVHFCGVLAIGAVVAVPGHTAASLGGCFVSGGLAGIAYAFLTAYRARKQRDYKPVLEDWVWHFVLPFIAYALLAVAGFAAFGHAIGAMYVVALTALMLLFIGIHNAWDSAVYISMHHRREQ